MAKIERGIYEPPSRDGEVFDGAEDEDEEEGSRLPLLIVIALLVLAAFGGVVWLAYTQGVQRGREDAPRIITAQRSPVREAPNGTASDSTDNKGLKIYEQPAPDDEAADDEESTPPAPTEVTKAPPAAATAGNPPAKISAAAPKTVAKTVTVAPVKTVREAAKTPPPAAAATVPPKENATETAPPAAAPTTGGYMLQLGAAKSEAEAMTTWHAFQSKHPMVGGYEPVVVRADLGSKGVWYRLRIGPFADKAAATAYCGKLKADGADCIPTK